ncbi:MAG TPA: respiratory nitrate reductase subunit gamma, partial [Pyrinomonadaceae bacterium]|nr:respiratory nitrate reductase subunit gamma [Pyrinomonadaceae bacterium]
LRSLFLLQPDLKMIAPLPFAVKLHIINAYVFLAILPFSRLVHMLVIPIPYLWRPYQLVIWNWDRRRNRPDVPKPVKEPVKVTQPAISDGVPVGKPVTAR